MRVDLQGQTALVTGAAQGIGQAIAKALTANGAQVAYADINGPAVQNSATEANGALAIEMDISDESQVRSGVAQVVRQLGRIDILVNNAGVNTAKHRVNIDQFPIEEWRRIVDIDLTGTYLVTKEVAQTMIPRRSGKIINISSVLGVVPARLQCAFIAAKSGVGAGRERHYC